MATKARKTQDAKKDELFAGELEDFAPVAARSSTKIVHIEPQDIINTVNSAVSNISSVFQLRDNLTTEVSALKSELSIGNEMKIESEKLLALKREQDEFLYEFEKNKARLERELKEIEEEHKAELEQQAEEQKALLKSEADAQKTKLKIEKEDHDRKILLEKEDWKREKAQLEAEKAVFTGKQKTFEQKNAEMREELTKELNRDNAHAIEILKLNHQKELEILKSELKLEQASRSKFETLLKEAREANEKLSKQLAELSKEALSSASTSLMAGKLKDLAAQMSGGSGTRTQ